MVPLFLGSNKRRKNRLLRPKKSHGLLVSKVGLAPLARLPLYGSRHLHLLDDPLHGEEASIGLVDGFGLVGCKVMRPTKRNPVKLC